MCRFRDGLSPAGSTRSGCLHRDLGGQRLQTEVAKEFELELAFHPRPLELGVGFHFGFKELGFAKLGGGGGHGPLRGETQCFDFLADVCQVGTEELSPVIDLVDLLKHEVLMLMGSGRPRP